MTLTPLDAKLRDIRDALHGGSWETMLTDLRTRLDARPYNHALHQRIARDIERVEQLARGEALKGTRRVGDDASRDDP